MTKKKPKFPETIFIVDVEYLNYIITDVKKHFTGILGRELPDIELNKLFTFLALDAGIPTGEKDVMVVFIHDNETQEILHSTPANIKNELHNMSFRSNLGDFQFLGMSTGGLATTEDFFLSALGVIAGSPDTKTIITIAFEDKYGEKLIEIISGKTSKEFVQFGMKKPDYPVTHKWDFLAFPLMQAFGIRGDEIN